MLNKSLKRIAIVSSGIVPAVKDGAVEVLTDMLLKENELNPKFFFHVYSKYNKKAVELTKNYKYSTFYFIDEDKTFNWLLNLYRRFFRLLAKKVQIKPFPLIYESKVARMLSNINYEAVIIKYNLEFIPNIRKYTKSPIISFVETDPFDIFNACSQEFNSICDSTDMFISVSNFIGKKLSNLIPNQRCLIRTCYNGINIRQFEKENGNNFKIQVLKNFNLPLDTKIILYVGRLLPVKGVKELLLSYSKISEQTNSVLLIIGSSGFKNSSMNTEYINELNKVATKLKNKVKFLGHVNYDEINKYQHICEFSVIPSFWEEAFGLVVVEGMAAGHPVIISDAGGMPELVTDNSALIIKRDSNFVENLAQSMKYLLENPSIVKEMGKHAYERAKLFSQEAYFNRFCELVKYFT